MHDGKSPRGPEPTASTSLGGEPNPWPGDDGEENAEEAEGARKVVRGPAEDPGARAGGGGGADAPTERHARCIERNGIAAA